MRVPIFQLDAFTTRRFAGNPAAVVVLDAFPDDASMLAIAAENNLAETAFLVRDGNGGDSGECRLRWFTPRVEVPLCGHATLASAAVLMERLQPGRESVVFHTASGPLPVLRRHDRYVLDFPARPSQAIAVPPELAAALGTTPGEAFVNAFNYMAVLESEQAVRALAPDFAAIARMDRPGVIVTAQAEANGRYDIVSRYFAPAKGVPEDPVTGAAHCMLMPYWTARLGRTQLRAFQASRRSGEILCRQRGDRVELEGSCVFYFEGEAEIAA